MKRKYLILSFCLLIFFCFSSCSNIFNGMIHETKLGEMNQFPYWAQQELFPVTSVDDFLYEANCSIDKWYYFHAEEGCSYRIIWADHNFGSSLLTDNGYLNLGNIKVSCFKAGDENNKHNTGFSGCDDGFFQSRTIYADKDAYYQIYVNCELSGAFALGVVKEGYENTVFGHKAFLPLNAEEYSYNVDSNQINESYMWTGEKKCFYFNADYFTKIRWADPSSFSVKCYLAGDYNVSSGKGFDSVDRCTDFFTLSSVQDAYYVLEVTAKNAGTFELTVIQYDEYGHEIDLSDNIQNDPVQSDPEPGSFELVPAGAILCGTRGSVTGYEIFYYSAGAVKYYYFKANAGKTYKINWADSYEGSYVLSGYSAADVEVECYLSGDENHSTGKGFLKTDSGYNYYKTVTAGPVDQYFVLKVTGYYQTPSGYFGIKVTEY